MVQIGFHAQGGPHDGQARAFDHLCQALHKGHIHQAQALRQMGGHHHATTHGLAMQPLAKTQTGFDGMAKGMSKVEDGAQAPFTLVLAHHLGLDLATALNRPGQSGWVAGQQSVQVGFDPIEESHVRNRAVFDDFGQTRAEFARRQALQGIQVAHHPHGLVESANHVLAQGVVDGGFTAHR